MFTLTKEFRFEAAHRLPAHDGKCARLHGHSWVGRVILQGDKLQSGPSPKMGMLQDYADIKAVLEPIIEAHLDHHFLNESMPLQDPTSEQVAHWLYERLKSELPLLLAVEIDETCTSSCRYQP